jgi:malate dehydrogenase
MRKKISIIGSGDVGTNAALFIAEKKTADVQLVDIKDGVPQGKCLDLMEAAPIRGYSNSITGGTDLSAIADSQVVVIAAGKVSAIADSQVVVIAAGKVRTPWMERADVLSDNATVVSTLIEPIIKYASEAVIVVVTEPVDAITYMVQKKTGFSRRRVIGMAGVLDEERLRYFIAEHLGVSVLDTTAKVIGGHHKYMIPLPQYCRVAGIPITELLDEDQIERLTERVRNANEEILTFLKTSSSCIAAAAAVAEIAEIILRDERRIVSAPVVLDGEYGLRDKCLGVPIILGANGVERIIELDLKPDQREALEWFANRVRDTQRAIAG